MQSINVEAIVLKSINYKDSHRIYTLLTKETGKISAIARGVRKISSKRSGSLDTLNNISISLNQDKNGYYSIKEVKIINSFSGIKNSLNLILTGMYLCELVDVFLDSDHELSEIFTLLKSALVVLSKNPSNPKILINVFEYRLLDKLGFELKSEIMEPSLKSLLYEIKTTKELSHLMNTPTSLTHQADQLIKAHLKNMVETYAKYPRLNRFLNEEVA